MLSIYIFNVWMFLSLSMTGILSKSIPEKRELTEKQQLLFDYATEGKFLKIATLCRKGVNANVADVKTGFTPLHLAVSGDWNVTIIVLVKCGVCINAADENGDTALHLAVKNDNKIATDLLLFYGADPLSLNKNQITPKDLAKDSKDPELLSSFDRAKWNKGRVLTDEEKELVELVKDGNYTGVALKFLDRVDIQVADLNNNLNTPLHLAATLSEDANVVPMIATLVRFGGDVNARNGDGNTPLHLAIKSPNPPVNTVELLFNRADPFVVNEEGVSPYQLAINSDDHALKGIFDLEQLNWYINGTSLPNCCVTGA